MAKEEKVDEKKEETKEKKMKKMKEGRGVDDDICSTVAARNTLVTARRCRPAAS